MKTWLSVTTQITSFLANLANLAAGVGWGISWMSGYVYMCVYIYTHMHIHIRICIYMHHHKDMFWL